MEMSLPILVEEYINESIIVVEDISRSDTTLVLYLIDLTFPLVPAQSADLSVLPLFL